VNIAASLLLGGLFSVRSLTTSAEATPAIAKAQPFAAASLAAEISPSQPRLGTKNIENIKASDLVLARDEHGSSIGLKPVKKTYRRMSDHLRHLTFETTNGGVRQGHRILIRMIKGFSGSSQKPCSSRSRV